MAAETCEIKKETSAEPICRLCFTEREHYQLIFVDEYSSLNEWIEKLTSLKIIKVPNAPAALCSECENTLKHFESFREMCFTNDRVFQEMFSQEGSNSDHAIVPEAMPVVNEIKMDLTDDQQTDILSFTIDSYGDILAESPDAEMATTSTLDSEDVESEINQTFITNMSQLESIAEECNSFSNGPTRQNQMQQRDNNKDNKEKPHVCSYCEKAFKRTNELKVHIRTHTQEKPYVCRNCNHSFSIHSNLVRHLRSPNGCKPYTCDMCHARYAHSSHLERHKLVHSKDSTKGQLILFSEETE